MFFNLIFNIIYIQESQYMMSIYLDEFSQTDCTLCYLHHNQESDIKNQTPTNHPSPSTQGYHFYYFPDF